MLEKSRRWSSNTPDESDAIAKLNGGAYLEASTSFAKAAQDRAECVDGSEGRAQMMNLSYSAFDTAGEAAATRHLGMEEDAEKLMASAKSLAAEALKHGGLTAARARAMRKLADSAVK
jgi:hypothetical protein